MLTGGTHFLEEAPAGVLTRPSAPRLAVRGRLFSVWSHMGSQEPDVSHRTCFFSFHSPLVLRVSGFLPHLVFFFRFIFRFIFLSGLLTFLLRCILFVVRCNFEGVSCLLFAVCCWRFVVGRVLIVVCLFVVCSFGWFVGWFVGLLAGLLAG